MPAPVGPPHRAPHALGGSEARCRAVGCQDRGGLPAQGRTGYWTVDAPSWPVTLRIRNGRTPLTALDPQSRLGLYDGNGTRGVSLPPARLGESVPGKVVCLVNG